MFTAYYISDFLESVVGVIDGIPLTIPFENKPFYYKTGYLMIVPEPEPPSETLFPPSFKLPERPDVPLEKLFPQRSCTIRIGDDVSTMNMSGVYYLTDDVQALEWFGRFLAAEKEASAYAKGDYAKYCQLIADRIGVPYISLDGIVAPRRLAPGAMTPEQVQETRRRGSIK